MSPGHYEVVVIGGGQAGLAIGYHLAQQDRRFTILDAGATPAAAWASRWDSLELFTSARYDSLPGREFPGEPDHYPTRDEVVGYLTDYARHFALPVELDSRVTGLQADDSGYRVELADRTLLADQVVVATGPFQTPRIPAIAGQLAGDVTQLHSADYRTPDLLPAGRVLVVGGGNTGFQIAEELAGSHEVHLAVGSRQTPLPQRILGRDVFRFLEATGLMNATVTSRIGRRMKDRETLIGSSPRAARRAGITFHARATDAGRSTVTFADGGRLDVDAVIWATGFERDHSWIDAPVFDGDGGVVHARGVTASPGLYFLGMPWQHTRGSALLGWVKDDAEHIAGRISAVARRPALSRQGAAPYSRPRSPARSRPHPVARHRRRRAGRPAPR
jgi:putative flavoprotein involved in K+ transport